MNKHKLFRALGVLGLLLSAACADSPTTPVDLVPTRAASVQPGDTLLLVWASGGAEIDLVMFASDSVVRTETVADTSLLLPPDIDSVSYAVRALDGYASPFAAWDTTALSLSGTVAYPTSAPMSLIAGAALVRPLTPAGQTLATAIAAFASSGTVSDYVSMSAAADALAQVHDPDDLETELALAYQQAVPDSALQDFYAKVAMVSDSTLQAEQGGASSVAMVAGTGDRAPLSVIHVNGVMTFSSLFGGAKQNRDALYELGLTIPSLASADYRYVYNRTQTNPLNSAHLCIDLLMRSNHLKWSLGRIGLFVSYCLSPTPLGDWLESFTQEMSQQYLTDPNFDTALVALDAYPVADSVESVIKGGGRALLVPHSQGNLMASEGLKILKSRGSVPAPWLSSCVSVLSVATPTNSFTTLGFPHRYVVVKSPDPFPSDPATKDFILYLQVLGWNTGVTTFHTEQSLQYDRELRSSMYFGGFLSRIQRDFALHKFITSYLADDGARQHIKVNLSWLADGLSASCGDPVASFSADVAIDRSVTFNASASHDPVDSTRVVQYGWDFGDGNMASDSVPTINHTYADDGDYTVSLTVWSNRGASSATVEEVVSVALQPAAIAVGPVDTLVTGQAFQLPITVLAYDSTALDYPVTWTTSDPTTLQVDSTGTVTPIPWVSSLTSRTVTATAGSVSRSVQVYFKAPVLRVIPITYDTLVVGQSRQYSAFGLTLKNDTVRFPISWSLTIGGTAGVTLDQDGLLTISQARQPDYQYLDRTYAYPKATFNIPGYTPTFMGGRTYFADGYPIEVPDNPSAASIVVHAPDTMVVGQHVDLSADVFDASGAALGAEVVWDVLDYPGAVDLTPAGHLYALTMRQNYAPITVRARAGAAVGTASIRIQKPVVRLAFSQDSLTLGLDSARIVAELLDSRGTVIPDGGRIGYTLNVTGGQSHCGSINGDWFVPTSLCTDSNGSGVIATYLYPKKWWDGSGWARTGVAAPAKFPSPLRLPTVALYHPFGDTLTVGQSTNLQPYVVDGFGRIRESVPVQYGVNGTYFQVQPNGDILAVAALSGVRGYYAWIKWPTLTYYQYNFGYRTPQMSGLLYTKGN